MVEQSMICYVNRDGINSSTGSLVVIMEGLSIDVVSCLMVWCYAHLFPV